MEPTASVEPSRRPVASSSMDIITCLQGAPKPLPQTRVFVVWGLHDDESVDPPIDFDFAVGVLDRAGEFEEADWPSEPGPLYS